MAVGNESTPQETRGQWSVAPTGRRAKHILRPYRGTTRNPVETRGCMGLQAAQTINAFDPVCRFTISARGLQHNDGAAFHSTVRFTKILRNTALSLSLTYARKLVLALVEIALVDERRVEVVARAPRSLKAQDGVRVG